MPSDSVVPPPNNTRTNKTLESSGQELFDQLKKTQQADGSWAGDPRWMEEKPLLATAYAVLALQEAIADLKEHPAK